jgi:hypothetical protein
MAGLDRERWLGARPREEPHGQVEVLAQVAQREERRRVAVLDNAFRRASSIGAMRSSTQKRSSGLFARLGLIRGDIKAWEDGARTDVRPGTPRRASVVQDSDKRRSRP